MKDQDDEGGFGPPLGLVALVEVRLNEDGGQLVVRLSEFGPVLHH